MGKGCTVSVPFTGILFLNELIKKYPEGVTMFPSPFRGSYFSIRIGIL